MNLHDYIAQQILPCYAHFDAAHRLDHVESVMKRSVEMAQHYPQVNVILVEVAAAYHDLGLWKGASITTSSRDASSDPMCSFGNGLPKKK